MNTRNSIRNWDGYGRKGQAVYDEMFEQEMNEADLMDSEYDEDGNEDPARVRARMRMMGRSEDEINEYLKS